MVEGLSLSLTRATGTSSFSASPRKCCTYARISIASSDRACSHSKPGKRWESRLWASEWWLELSLSGWTSLRRARLGLRGKCALFARIWLSSLRGRPA
jgi:hypothetical protein